MGLRQSIPGHLIQESLRSSSKTVGRNAGQRRNCRTCSDREIDGEVTYVSSGFEFGVSFGTACLVFCATITTGILTVESLVLYFRKPVGGDGIAGNCNGKLLWSRDHAD